MKTLLALLLAATTTAAQAALIVQLNPSSPANPGDSVIFSGTLTNTGTTDLNLDAMTLDLSAGGANPLLFDQDPFYNGTVPLVLGSNPYNGPIFGIQVWLDQTGPITGTATITAHEQDQDPFDTVVPFTVQAVPEPMPVLALTAGVALVLRRRRR